MGKSHIGVHTESTLAVATTPAALALTDTSRSVGMGKSHIGVYTKSTRAQPTTPAALALTDILQSVCAVSIGMALTDIVQS